MALLGVTNIAPGTPSALVAAAAGGDTVPRGDLAFLVVNNPTAAAITVTIDTPGLTHGLAIADEGVAVAAGARVFIPIQDEVFVHPSDHLIHLTYSAPGLQVAAFSL